MGKNRFKSSQIKREGGGFAPLPFAVIRSRGFTHLSAHAVKLLIDLLAQYKGDNNGDLCAAWTIMRGRGWKSKETLNKALKELKEGDWVEVTRQGGRHKASLYGLTFYAIDDCKGKLDVRSTSSPRGTWKKNEPLPAMPKLKVVPLLSGTGTALQVADANAINGGTPSVSIAR
ncbi:hypothetical protein C8R21_10652 [Nitrosospira multiformis]|uniref:Helix-turn-helix domain-containing protein n=1 Tax=Nitrosospira multiformis TaxID=1231 RepID=A0A2T5IE33_9PROT|nr:hypothetical protein [Nitrosospira multiformis]PTQ82073.1 hypothetical protein C8R21_10652 [Nitrosospira multiformis]